MNSIEKKIFGSCLQIFQIQVRNANRMAPIFEQKQFSATIKENLECSPEKFYFVMQVKARDDDFGEFGHIRYSILKQDIKKNSINFMDYFAIDSDLGVLTLKKSLDREAFEEYNFVVKAVDGGGLFDTGKIF